MGKISRRVFMESGSKLAIAAAAVASSSGLISPIGAFADTKKTSKKAPKPAKKKSGVQMVTDVESNKPMLKALKYESASTHKGQSCADCNFYQAPKDGVGKCLLIPVGFVSAAGWCASYVKKP